MYKNKFDRRFQIFHRIEKHLRLVYSTHAAMIVELGVLGIVVTLVVPLSRCACGIRGIRRVGTMSCMRGMLMACHVT